MGTGGRIGLRNDHQPESSAPGAEPAMHDRVNTAARWIGTARRMFVAFKHGREHILNAYQRNKIGAREKEGKQFASASACTTWLVAGWTGLACWSANFPELSMSADMSEKGGRSQRPRAAIPAALSEVTLTQTWAARLLDLRGTKPTMPNT